MKILVSYRAAPRIRGWETGAMVSRAFRKLGHEVHEYAKEYQTDRWLTNGPHSDVFSLTDSIFTDMEIAERHIWPRDMLKQEYDLVLNMECNDPDPQYFELVGVTTKKRAVWNFDASYYVSTALDHIARYHPDHVFFANSRFMEFGWDSCSWLPYAADSTDHFRPLDGPRPIDVALVGSDRPDRRKLINTLKKAGINAQLISDVFREQYVDALASSKVIINENPAEGRGLLNMRSFEAPAAGAVLLSNDKEIAEVFTPGMQVLIYSDVEHAIMHCKMLLDYPTERIGLQVAGHFRARDSHTYENRATEILDVMGL
jgi:hypothetical protein